jgi:serine/threonine protein kinase
MIGKTISHYKILEKLGEGGMGVVYRARDTRLERDVALKFLSPHALGTEEDHARLLREARAAAALNHPSICTVHEIETAEGQTFIAMECVEGEDLRARLESGPLGVSGALRIAANIADGLSEAHAKSITHRDIKPANIVIAPTDRVKIMDFGLARLGGGAQLTKTGATLGTIAYMSPEQARGDPVDHRTDIWSLGVVLYEMLTGERPFRGDYDQAVIYSILNEEPEPLASIRSEVPAALDAILAVVLAKSPASRYQSAQELARDLRACRDELESPRSASDTPRSRPRPSIAVMPFADMSPEKDQEYFCDGMSEEIINALTQVEGLRVIARTSAFAFKGKNEDIREIGRKLSVATLLEGSVRKAGERLRITAQLVAVGDGAHLWSERYDRQLDDVFAIQDEIAVAIAERLKIELTPQEKRRLTAPRQVAPDVYEAYLRASQYLCRFFPLILRDPKHQQKVIELFQRVVDCAPDYALAWAGLADAYSFICRWVSPDISWVSRDTSCPRARAAAVRALELDDNLAEAHTAMGRVYLSADFDWKSAKREHMRAVELNPGSAEAHCEFGMHLVW